MIFGRPTGQFSDRADGSGDPPVRPPPDGRRGEIGHRGGDDPLQGVDEAVGFVGPGRPARGTLLGERALAFGADEDDEVLHHAPPALGEDGEAILAEYGFSVAEIAAFKSEGVVG